MVVGSVGARLSGLAVSFMRLRRALLLELFPYPSGIQCSLYKIVRVVLCTLTAVGFSFASLRSPDFKHPDLKLKDPTLFKMRYLNILTEHPVKQPAGSLRMSETPIVAHAENLLGVGLHNELSSPFLRARSFLGAHRSLIWHIACVSALCRLTGMRATSWFAAFSVPP